MGRLARYLLGMPAVITLMLLYALFSALATFVENDFGTESAWALIYTSWYFALIQLWLGVALVYCIFKYKLFRKEKLPSLIFHASFIFMLLGAVLTRYYGFEGSLHIREGNKENRVVSLEPYVRLTSHEGEKTYTQKLYKLFSNVEVLGVNNFKLKMPVEDKEATLTYKEFVPNATTKLIVDTNGVPLINLVISYKNEPLDVIMSQGDMFRTDDVTFIFASTPNPPLVPSRKIVYFYVKDGKFYMQPNVDVDWMKMSDQSEGIVQGEEPAVTDRLFTYKDTTFVAKNLLLAGKEIVVNEPAGKGEMSKASAIIAELEYNGEKKEVRLYGYGRGGEGHPAQVEVGGRKFIAEWGSVIHRLPFNVELVEFQLERYPGSMSPSSYASEVKVIDSQNDTVLPYRIYMNHVLDYAGFRFFQSSYDTDEKGTILSVNQDPGKWPTYLGYTLLCIGLFFNILNPKSRFQKLARSLSNAPKAKKTLGALLVASLAFFAPQGAVANDNLNSANMENFTDEQRLELFKKFDLEHAKKCGTLLVQGSDGRIKPVDTVAHDILNKVYRSDSYKGVDANQVFLGMMILPRMWQKEAMIRISTKEVKKLVGLDEAKKYASFDDFFEKDGDFDYKLSKHVEIANRKKPAERNLFDKDVLKVDERWNVAYLGYLGELLRAVPKRNDLNNTWYSPKSAVAQFPADERMQVQNMLASYFSAISKGLESGDWKDANEALNKLKSYQHQYSAEIMPTSSKVEMEIKFNELQIFNKLKPFYLLVGFVLLFAILFKLAFPKLKIDKIARVAYWTNILLFTVNTFGLGLRWYISGHAPWSNSYESMIYIAWALALTGIVFAKRSPISLALTSILAGITLMVVHMSWMDPQITNIVLVLKSYWLTIHVSVIMASYGFLGLCSLLGIFTLVLMLLRNPKKDDERGRDIDNSILEATRINEMAMILGLSLLIVGNFLGGVWANESWGRYWGWDAKETWTLVSILVYAIIVHFRFVPKLNSQYLFAVTSMFAYWAIIMTYFGVNFYLSGMHSYASGDPVPVPSFVPVIAGAMGLLAVVTWFKRGVSKTL